jgi:cytochrome c-type biogenesis protein CcmH/NrfG
MKNFCKAVITGLIMMAFLYADAQDVNSLIKEGQQLNSEKRYTEAVVKYKSAIAIEPDNAKANYELAFALYSGDKGTEGIPYLQKAVTLNASPQLTAGAYSLMGSIYSSINQFQKAISAYVNGIKTDSTNQRLYYNLGIAQYRAKQYPDAAQSFIGAVKFDSSYAAAVRMYALSTFHQNKRADALLGFCRFLMLEPDGAQSAEAFGNLQNILNGGSLKPEPGYKASAATKVQAAKQNALLSKALAGFAARRYTSPAALLTAQLKAAFAAATANNYTFAAYLDELAQTEHCETFVRTISQKAYPENGKWLMENSSKTLAYNEWLNNNKPKL